MLGAVTVRIDHVVERLRGLNVPFGNGPEAIDNGLTHDPLGSEGRVYFTSPDGHLFEVTVHPFTRRTSGRTSGGACSIGRCRP